MEPAITFDKSKSDLFLYYSPRDDDTWVYARFDRDEEIIIKKTFFLRKENLEPIETSHSRRDNEEEYDELESCLRFKVATLDNDYYSFNQNVLKINYQLLIHHDAPISWKWFTAEQRISIFREIAEIRPQRIVIGGEKPDAIPIEVYEKLLLQFPTKHELKRYTLARIDSVIREYSDTSVDAEKLFHKYVKKRLSKNPKDLIGLFRNEDKLKYQFLLERLTIMLETEDSYPESTWQEEILQIILLLNPKYIKAIGGAPVWDNTRQNNREIDILLIDASGNIDVVEIKKPFDKCIITPGQYRNNHIPLRELSGSVMQIEKYIYFLNRWGEKGEETLTNKYKKELPDGFSIKITNPSGIIIMGRDNNLSEIQRRDFEVVKRKYKNIVDIITYDDLLRRLDFIIKNFESKIE